MRAHAWHQCTACVRLLAKKKASPCCAIKHKFSTALSGFVLPTKVFGFEAGISMFCADFLERLKSVARSPLVQGNPKMSFCFLCSRLQPEILKDDLRKRLKYDESLENFVKVFIKVLTQDAISWQSYDAMKATNHPQNF